MPNNEREEQELKGCGGCPSQKQMGRLFESPVDREVRLDRLVQIVCAILPGMASANGGVVDLRKVAESANNVLKCIEALP